MAAVEGLEIGVRSFLPTEMKSLNTCGVDDKKRSSRSEIREKEEPSGDWGQKLGRSLAAESFSDAKTKIRRTGHV